MFHFPSPDQLLPPRYYSWFPFFRAAAKFRAKRKKHIETTSKRITELENDHTALMRDVVDLRKENKFLRVSLPSLPLHPYPHFSFLFLPQLSRMVDLRSVRRIVHETAQKSSGYALTSLSTGNGRTEIRPRCRRRTEWESRRRGRDGSYQAISTPRGKLKIKTSLSCDQVQH